MIRLSAEFAGLAVPRAKGHDCCCMQAGIEFIPGVLCGKSCLLLAEPFVILEPANATMALSLSDDQPSI